MFYILFEYVSDEQVKMTIENRGPELQAVAYTLMAAAIVATLLRCYTRLSIVKGFGFDDWCMVFALVSSPGRNIQWTE